MVDMVFYLNDQLQNQKVHFLKIKLDLVSTRLGPSDQWGAGGSSTWHCQCGVRGFDLREELKVIRHPTVSHQAGREPGCS